MEKLVKIKKEMLSHQIKRTYKQRIPFSRAEDDLIKETIKNYPTNIVYSASKIHKLLPDRSEQSILKRWYNSLRNDKAVITTGSSKGFTSNIKNTFRDSKKEMPPVRLNNLVWLITELMNLDTKDLDAILRVIKYK